MQDKFKGKGAILLQAAAVVAVAALFGSEVAMAGADTTFNTALSSFTGFLEGSGGKIIARNSSSVQKPMSSGSSRCAGTVYLFMRQPRPRAGPR